jgi:hypothetical protein
MGVFKDQMGDKPYLPPERPSYARHRPTDPEPSVKAARALNGRLTVKQKAVLDTHKANPAGLADPELTELLGGPPGSSTWRSRRKELTDAGLIDDSGEKRVFNGREHTVWRYATWLW